MYSAYDKSWEINKLMYKNKDKFIISLYVKILYLSRVTETTLQ